MNVLVRLKPDSLPLPVRAHYAAGEPWQVGINHLSLYEERWYALADVLAGWLHSGVRPTVTKAPLLVPTGSAADLRSVLLGGEIPVDPAKDDFFCTLVEERTRVGDRADLKDGDRQRLEGDLKTIGNSVAYGIQAETLPQDLPVGERASREIWSVFDSPAHIETEHPEDLRHFGFMPLAACVTAGARLMLALLEHQVTAAGGSYVMTDTDSMAIVASETGGLIAAPGGQHRDLDGREAVNALSWAEVDHIMQRFSALNPYSPAVVPGSIIKVEKENFDAVGTRSQLWCYAISANRYCLFTWDGACPPEIVKYSEHGLGHLLNPIDPDN